MSRGTNNSLFEKNWLLKKAEEFHETLDWHSNMWTEPRPERCMCCAYSRPLPVSAHRPWQNIFIYISNNKSSTDISTVTLCLTVRKAHSATAHHWLHVSHSSKLLLAIFSAISDTNCLLSITTFFPHSSLRAIIEASPWLQWWTPLWRWRQVQVEDPALHRCKWVV